MRNSFEDPGFNTEEAVKALRGTPAYYGWCLLNYHDRVINFLDQKQLSVADFNKELKEIVSIIRAVD